MNSTPTASRVVRLASVDSTQRYAAELAAAGAADGTVVVADTQTAGRGRRGRVWDDTPGASLLLSIVIRSSLAPALLPTLSLAAGVAVAEALETAASVTARLKWPNDVLVDGRKIAGILLERHGTAVVLGAGVNVSQRSFPEALATRATSVAREGGRADREAILPAVLDAIGRWRERLEREGFEAVRARWAALATLGGQVRVDGVAGVALGLDDDGALLVGTVSGAVRVLAGDVVELG